LERLASRDSPKVTKEQPTEHKMYWDDFLDHFIHHEVVEEEKQLEKSLLSEAITMFGEVLSKEMRSSKLNVEMKDLVPKLILFLQYGFVNKADP